LFKEQINCHFVFSLLGPFKLTLMLRT